MIPILINTGKIVKKMNEEEFAKECPEWISVPVYYGIDDNGKVIIDEESMTEEFNGKLDDILEETRLDKDELKELVKEKLKKDEKEKH